MSNIYYCILRKDKKVKPVLEKRVVVGVEDMVLLQQLSDEGIVSNLRSRLTDGQIYTYIGHVLVVCNPYKWLPIYEKNVMKQYAHVNRVDVPPHVNKYLCFQLCLCLFNVYICFCAL